MEKILMILMKEMQEDKQGISDHLLSGACMDNTQYRVAATRYSMVSSYINRVNYLMDQLRSGAEEEDLE